MKSVNIYLNYDGNAEEAFMFYRSVFGGEFKSLQRFADTPQKDQLPESDWNKIMHISLPVEQSFTLLASDILPSLGHEMKVGNNFYLSVNVDSKEDADRIFKALSVGGRIEMPIQKMFWGAYFGMFEDRFGVQWMINYEPAA